MKLGDKEIKTGLELARDERKAPSVTAKIEAKIKEFIVKKFGYILSEYEVKQIIRRERDVMGRRDEAVARSQWNILRSRERAKLKEKIRRDIQEGKLFKKHEKKEGRQNPKDEPESGPHLERRTMEY